MVLDNIFLLSEHAREGNTVPGFGGNNGPTGALGLNMRFLNLPAFGLAGVNSPFGVKMSNLELQMAAQIKGVIMAHKREGILPESGDVTDDQDMRMAKNVAASIHRALSDMTSFVKMIAHLEGKHYGGQDDCAQNKQTNLLANGFKL